MVSRPVPLAPRCKCCGGVVSAFAELDATRSCEDRRGTVFPPSGRMIAYWRCGACGFVFTVDFDALSPAELGALIYNDDYTRADPDFAIKRPTFFADILASLLSPAAAWIDVLDFGGGCGTLTDMMRARGFARFATHDPYFGDSALPPRRYDLVTAFEVVEHSRDPVDMFGEIAALRKSDGAVLFSTLLQPKAAGPDWWYIAPRNGHVSIHTSRSLRAAAQQVGLRYLPLNEGMHLLYTDRAGRVPRLITEQFASQALRHASLRDAATLLWISIELGRLGQARVALDPHHIARLLIRGRGG